MLRVFVAIVFVVVCQSCFLFQGKPVVPDIPEEEPLPSFLSTPSSYPIQRGIIDEISGMAPSKSFPGDLWMVEDGDTSPSIHLVSGLGVYKGKVDLPLFNRDWEDLSAGPGPTDGQNYLYIGEIGDNVNNHKNYMIYRLKEPTSLTDNNLNLETINFRYNDVEAIDVEAMFVDPVTLDIYLISKRQIFSVRVYKISYPYSTTAENTAVFLGTIPHSSITAADISSDGQQIIIKDYSAVFYWRLKPFESIFEALSRSRDVGLPYYVEPQGEALCFDSKGSGYYTLSELQNAPQVSLNYYQRKATE